MKLATLLALPLLVAPALQLAAVTPGESARMKIDRFYNGTLKPGEVIVFSPDEINAWVRYKVPTVVPEGVRNPHLELGTDTVTASALVDFVKMREGLKESVNPLFAAFLEGERPLRISVRLSSGGGRCTVYLTRVELGGAVAEGAVLDFLLKTFFTPMFPDAKIGQPFELDFNMERIDIRPAGARITIKK